MPLDFLLGIMRDENRDSLSRLDAAKAAAPYCHARVSSTEVSGPSDAPVSVQTTNILDVSHITDEAELDALERALRKTIAGLNQGEIGNNAQKLDVSRQISVAGLSSRSPTKTVWRRSPSSDQLR